MKQPINAWIILHLQSHDTTQIATIHNSNIMLMPNTLSYSLYILLLVHKWSDVAVSEIARYILDSYNMKDYEHLHARISVSRSSIFRSLTLKIFEKTLPFNPIEKLSLRLVPRASILEASLSYNYFNSLKMHHLDKRPPKKVHYFFLGYDSWFHKINTYSYFLFSFVKY